MQDEIKISVVIPNYNRADQLVAAVESVLRQSYPALEILVCDDGSEDDSADRIKRLDNPVVKWISCGKNGMPSVPRNRGIQKSSGNWIAFLDNDDVWHETKLEEQVKAIKQSGCQAVCTNALVIQEGKEPRPYHAPLGFTEITFDILTDTNYVMCSSVLVSKKALEEAGLFSERRDLKAIEDYDLWLKIVTHHNFYYVDKKLVYYTDDASSSIRSDSLALSRQLSNIFNEYSRWASSRNVGKEKIRIMEKKFIFSFFKWWQLLAYKFSRS